MNRTYKVIWSKARHCYVVVSELTKSQHKSSSKSELISTNVHRGGVLGKAAVAAIVAGLLTFGGVAYSPVLAADKDIVKGDSAEIKYDINRTNDGTNIAVGKNAKVFIGGGTQESMLSFGEKVYQGSFSMHIHDNNHAKQNLPEAIAVGTNSYARTGAIEIGAHTLDKNKIAIGDTTADKLRQFGVASTTLGTNSYTGGGFATTIGSYNVQSSQYEAKDDSDKLFNTTKNAFATVIGTFNSNESMKGRSSSGVANMIAGTANKVTNSNGAIVMGAGNSVKDSSASFDATAYTKHFNSVIEMQKALMDGVASSAGGATLVIGGANSAEKTQNSQIMGVGNSMKSTTDKKVQYNYLDGFNSSITDASHVKVLGQGVTINKGADSNTVIGDYRTVADGQTHNVIIGNADETAPITTEKKDTVILGHNANATVDGGVALGDGSVASVDKASVDKNAIGYDPVTKKASTDTSSTWKSTAAAVSVGDASKNLTRQITNVAAGKEDTDAVNVAQLKSAQIHYYSMNPKSGAATGANSNYNNNGATGDDAIAIGPFASAQGKHSLALGYGAQTTHLEGEDSKDDNTAIGYNSQSGYRSTALGYNSQATGRYAVTLGTDALADKDNSTAVGMNAQAEGKQATALGSLARASGESATAVGEGAEALANYSSAVGLGAKVDEGATKGTALGYQAKVLTGENSMALGAGSQVSGANSMAIGMNAQVSGAKSVAIGQGAKVSVKNSVALGQGSEASGNLNDYNVMSLTIPNLGTSYRVSGGYPDGIVSVGNDKVVRTITNVAAGRVTPTSTDAVNGSELYDVATEAAKHATVKAAANSRITVDNTGVNKGKGIEYTIGLNTDGLAKSTDGLTFAGDDGKSDNSKVISRKLNEQLNIVGGATETVDAANIGVVRKDDDTLNIRLAKDITGLNSLQATTVTSGNVTVDGQHNVITGLSNTTWDDKNNDYSKSTRAATEAQLHDAMTQAAADANDTHIKAGDYAGV